MAPAAATRRRKRQSKQRKRAEAGIEHHRRPCGCDECQFRRLWPTHYLGSNGGNDLAPEVREQLLASGRLRRYLLSYECYLELTTPDFKVVDERPSFDGRMSPPVAEPRKRKLGLATGMSVLPKGRIRHRYVSGCEGPGDGREETCGGLRPVGRRYCLNCEDRMTRELAAAGYSPEQIEAWCARGKFPAEPAGHGMCAPPEHNS